MSVLLYSRTASTETKRLKIKLNGNYARMSRSFFLDKSWKHHSTCFSGRNLYNSLILVNEVWDFFLLFRGNHFLTSLTRIILLGVGRIRKTYRVSSEAWTGIVCQFNLLSKSRNTASPNKRTSAHFSNPWVFFVQFLSRDLHLWL